MALTITHAQVAGTGTDADAIVDGADWDANHTIAGSIAASEVTSGAALTKTDDTNVTLTLGGAPTTALLTATSVTVGWTGQLALSRGGTNADLSATGGAGQYLKQASVGATVTVGTIPASDIASGAALTRTNDTNVTLTLGGTSSTALLAATSITVGWSGSLAVARGGTGLASATAYAVLCGGTTATGAFQSIAGVGTSGQVLTSNGAGALPTFQPATASGVSSIAGNTGAFTLANGIDNSTNQIQLTAARRTLPTTQVFLSGSGTYTTPANCLWIEIELIGGGGGGQGSGTTPGSGGGGGATTWGTGPLLSSGTASGATSSGVGGAGGIPSGGYINKTGSAGQRGAAFNLTHGGCGGIGFPGGNVGFGGVPGASAGIAGGANTGSGGGGGGVNTTVDGGSGGGAGGYLRAIINSPSATYSYAVGAGGTAGTAGTSGAAGGAGGSGFIQVIEHYGS